MSGLIPQLRADRNGKIVTRHIRADAASAAGARSIPKPSLSSSTPQAVDNPVDDLDALFTLGPYNYGSGNGVVVALSRDFKTDYSKTVQLSSRQWYEARRVGLHDQQIHSLMLAGITDVQDMLEYGRKYDRQLSENHKPGIRKLREKWVDACLEAGITKERFDLANSNFGMYGILNTLEDFNLKGSPVDVVNIYADYPSRQTGDALMRFIWNGSLDYGQLRKIGVSRVRKYAEQLDRYVVENKKISVDQFIELIKREETRFSPVSPKADMRIRSRMMASKLWGFDRAMELDEPLPANIVDGALQNQLHSMGEKGFALAKYQSDLMMLSLERDSASRVPQDKTTGADFSKSKTYKDRGQARYFMPTVTESTEFFDMGLSPEEAIDAMEMGLSPASYRGVKEEGITQSIAEGWL